MKKIILLGAAAIAFAATPTLAQMQHGNGAPVTRAQIETNVRDQFAMVDANRDGAVTKAEGEAFRASARTQRRGGRSERREAVFARLDANGDGSISRAEFDAPRAQGGDRAERRGDRTERRADRMERRGDRGLARFGGKGFERLDADKDGRVTLAEATAQRLLRFDRVDANKDGAISGEERRAARAERQARRG